MKQPGKTERVIQLLESEITTGRRKPGERFPAMRQLAEAFDVSLRSVQIALEKLEAAGLVERRPRCGVCVAENARVVSGVTFLIPYPNFPMSGALAGTLLWRNFLGAQEYAAKHHLPEVTLLPVSRTATFMLERIDFEALEPLGSRSRVVVTGPWYEPLYDFLLKRNVRGVYIGDEMPECFRNHPLWSQVCPDRFSAMENAVIYLHSTGRNRIAVLKNSGWRNTLFDRKHPVMDGYRSGLELSELPFIPELVKCYHGRRVSPMIDHNFLFEMTERWWNQTRFDAIIFCEAEIPHVIAAILQRKLRKTIPEEIALLSLTDCRDAVLCEPPISAMEYPWQNIGRCCMELLCGNFTNAFSSFHPALFERESTRKGAGAYINRRFLPECCSGLKSFNI